jgi:hypothetical protein
MGKKKRGMRKEGNGGRKKEGRWEGNEMIS